MKRNKFVKVGIVAIILVMVFALEAGAATKTKKSISKKRYLELSGYFVSLLKTDVNYSQSLADIYHDMGVLAENFQLPEGIYSFDDPLKNNPAYAKVSKKAIKDIDKIEKKLKKYKKKGLTKISQKILDIINKRNKLQRKIINYNLNTKIRNMNANDPFLVKSNNKVLKYNSQINKLLEDLQKQIK